MPRDAQEETYKAHAAECLEIARQTDDREGKIALLDIARAWLALADQHRKNSQASQGWKSAERRQASRRGGLAATLASLTLASLRKIGVKRRHRGATGQREPQDD